MYKVKQLRKVDLTFRLTFITIRKYYILEILFPINILKTHKKKNIGKKRKTDFTREDWSAFTTLMSIKNTTFKYEEYEMEIDRAHNDVLIAINDNEEVEIVKC